MPVCLLLLSVTAGGLQRTSKSYLPRCGTVPPRAIFGLDRSHSLSEVQHHVAFCPTPDIYPLISSSKRQTPTSTVTRHEGTVCRAQHLEILHGQTPKEVGALNGRCGPVSHLHSSPHPNRQPGPFQTHRTIQLDEEVDRPSHCFASGCHIS